MSELSQPYLGQEDLLLERSRALRIAIGSDDLFPDSIDTLHPTRIQSLDKQALLMVGALGTQAAFDTLDSWLRYKVTESNKLHEELEKNPLSLYAAIQKASKYIVGLRVSEIIPGLDHTHPLENNDPNLNAYRRHPLFREVSIEAQFNPSERHSLNRVRLVKISIFAEMLHVREEGSFE